jgi:hypothetical protein
VHVEVIGIEGADARMTTGAAVEHALQVQQEALRDVLVSTLRERSVEVGEVAFELEEVEPVS